MKHILICSFILLASISLKAQDFEIKPMEDIFNIEDSLTVFNIEDLYGLIFANHPVVKQADIIIDNAAQELMKSRGNFDPKISSIVELKDYKNTEYYNIINGELKVPIWFPIDPKISIDRNRGTYLNPERFISETEENRQITAGLSLPLGRGLLIDDRRASVKQAEIFQNISEAERIKMINKIFFSAAKDYWDWYFSFYNYRIADQGLDIAVEIYRRVMLSYEFGEASALDTAQAAITLQERRAGLQQALIEYINSKLRLSNYLWNEDVEPLELSDNLIPFIEIENPTLISEGELSEIKENAINIHPELRKLNLKLDQLEIDRRLNVENLKPQLDLEYNFVNEPINQDGDFVEPLLDENVKFGLNFSFPLFLRKQRAELQKTKLKIDETTYEFDFRTQEIFNSIDASFAELINTRQLISIQQVAVNNYQTLLQGELINLQNGESDLFKINVQQEKLLDSQSKFLKTRAKYEKIKAQLYWNAGVPYLNVDVE